MFAVSKVLLDGKHCPPDFHEGFTSDPSVMSLLTQSYPGYNLLPDPVSHGDLLAMETQSEALPDVAVLKRAELIIGRFSPAYDTRIWVTSDLETFGYIHLNTQQFNRLLTGVYPYVAERLRQANVVPDHPVPNRIVFVEDIYRHEEYDRARTIADTMVWLNVPPHEPRHRLKPVDLSYSYADGQLTLHRGWLLSDYQIHVPDYCRRELFQLLLPSLRRTLSRRRGWDRIVSRHLPGTGIVVLPVKDNVRIYVDGLFLCNSTPHSFSDAWTQYGNLLMQHAQLLQSVNQEQ